MNIGIMLNEIETVKEFINVVNQFESDIDITSGKYRVNAKSIIGMFALDLSKPVYVSMISDDDFEIELFKGEMEQFEYKIDSTYMSERLVSFNKFVKEGIDTIKNHDDNLKDLNKKDKDNE